MSETRLKLELSLSEVNQILDALGHLPYRDVYELIGSLQDQAQRQLVDASRPRPDTAEDSREERR